MRTNFLAAACCLITLGATGFTALDAQECQVLRTAPSRITQAIDDTNTVTLTGHVRRGLNPENDLGLVEESLPVHLFLNLKRTPAQQADLDALLAAQQNPKSPMFHKWLTPEEFGARFGASESDVQKIREWLEAEKLEVVGVGKNRSVINIKTTAAGVRETSTRNSAMPMSMAASISSLRMSRPSRQLSPISSQASRGSMSLFRTSTTLPSTRSGTTPKPTNGSRSSRVRPRQGERSPFISPAAATTT